MCIVSLLSFSRGLDFLSRNCNKLRRDAQTNAVSDGEGGYRARYSMLSSLIHCGGKLGEAESGEARFGEARIGGEAGRAEVKAGGEAEASDTSEAADVDGSGCGTGEEGDPGCEWGTAETQEGGWQVRVVVGLCSRINFRTAMKYPSIHVLFQENLPAFSDASPSPSGPILPFFPSPTFAAEPAAAARNPAGSS
jgi:hypothetical protein